MKVSCGSRHSVSNTLQPDRRQTHLVAAAGSKHIQDGSQFSWDLCLESQLSAGTWVSESKLGSVQKLPVQLCDGAPDCGIGNSFVSPAAIDFISNDRVL